MNLGSFGPPGRAVNARKGKTGMEHPSWEKELAIWPSGLCQHGHHGLVSSQPLLSPPCAVRAWKRSKILGAKSRA